MERQYDDHALEGVEMGNLGTANLQLGNYQRAIDFYDQFLTIARKIGGRHCQGQAGQAF